MDEKQVLKKRFISRYNFLFPNKERSLIDVPCFKQNMQTLNIDTSSNLMLFAGNYYVDKSVFTYLLSDLGDLRSAMVLSFQQLVDISVGNNEQYISFSDLPDKYVYIFLLRKYGFKTRRDEDLFSEFLDKVYSKSMVWIYCNYTPTAFGTVYPEINGIIDSYFFKRYDLMHAIRSSYLSTSSGGISNSQKFGEEDF